MITKWRLFNFKSIRDETDLEFGPLTIFAGSNSSGKSTILQSMLMISQTLASQVGSRSVVLNGPLVKLGQFDDLKSFSGGADQILIGWTCKPVTDEPSSIRTTDYLERRYLRARNLAEVTCELSFEIDPSSAKSEIQQLQPRLFGCTLETSTSERSLLNKSRLSVNRAPVDPVERARKLETQHDSSDIISGLGFDVEFLPGSLPQGGGRDEIGFGEPVGCFVNHFLPLRLVVRFDAIEELAYQIVYPFPGMAPFRGFGSSDRETVIPDSVMEILEKSLGDLASSILESESEQLTLFPGKSLRDWSIAIRRLPRQEQLKVRDTLAANQEELIAQIRAALSEEMGQQYRLGIVSLPRELADGYSYLERFFARSVKYLGPLRDEPKPLYPLAANTDPTDIGLRGEHTAAVLDLHKAELIRYLPSANFVSPHFSQETKTRTLERAVLDWLQYLGVADAIETRDRGKLGHELKITTPGTEIMHDLTHVGVGVSQVLPILVISLLADSDTTLLIEQPELHLHPKVQTLLGDFFLSMASIGKQIIVETHSEYIINRLRFRAAAAAGEQIASLMKIYFAEKKEGASVFREINVNRYGAITDWPEGFFDQSQSEAEGILRAATRKRKAERGD